VPLLLPEQILDLEDLAQVTEHKSDSSEEAEENDVESVKFQL
jgi:hypothetical protein